MRYSITSSAQKTYLIWVARLISVCAMSWTIWILSNIVWSALGFDKQHLQIPPQLLKKSTSTSPVDLSSLTSIDLFNSPVSIPNTSNAPDTNLQLKLTGVFVNTNPKLSTAIVGDKNNAGAQSKVYRINETLPGGATLVKVFDDSILLNRGTGDETLRFEKTATLSGADNGNNPTDKKLELLQSTRLQMNQNPQQFLQQMGLTPTAQGYEVNGSSSAQLRAQLGLQAGDKILRINNRNLGNIQQDKDILNNLKSGDPVKIEIQRGKQTLTFQRNF